MVKNPSLKILRVLPKMPSDAVLDAVSIESYFMFETLKLPKMTLDLATFWLFCRSGYEILDLCNQVLSILVNLPRLRR